MIVQGDVIVRDGTGREPCTSMATDRAELLVGSPAGKRGHLGVVRRGRRRSSELQRR